MTAGAAGVAAGAGLATGAGLETGAAPPPLVPLTPGPSHFNEAKAVASQKA